MNTQVIVSQGAVTFSEMERLAESIAKSQLFGMKTKEQALALMMVSQAEGRHPALAARDYDIISGRPSKKAEAMLRDFLEASGKVEWHKLDDTVADATFSHPSGGVVRITWDHERVKTAGISNGAMYKKYPRQMLRSRCVSEGVRTVCPAATSGMYVPEEVADFEPRGQVTVVPSSAPALTPPPAPKTMLTPEEEAALDRKALREVEGYIPDHDPETGEVIEVDDAKIFVLEQTEAADSCATINELYAIADNVNKYLKNETREDLKPLWTTAYGRNTTRLQKARAR